MIFAHASVGIIISWIIISLNKKKINSFHELLIFAAGAIGAIFPDFDLLYIFFIDPTESHRNLISHSVIPYLIFAVGSFLIFRLLNCKKAEYLVLTTFLLGVLSHLATDMVVGPVYFLKPFINSYFIWDPFPIANGDFINYVLSPYMMLEIVIILVSILLLIQKLTIHKKEFRLILFLLATIQIGAWIALLPFIY